MLDFLKQILILLIYPTVVGLFLYNSYTKFKSNQKELINIGSSKKSKAYLVWNLVAHGFIIVWMVLMLLVYYRVMILPH